MGKKGEHLYLRLADALTEKIINGTYPEGSLLPSERELCEQFNLSRTTVRQALQELAQKGYAKSLYGKGTVVIRPQIRQELSAIYSFDEDMRRLGKTPRTQILDFVEILANTAIASQFGLPVGTPLYRIMRLRLADDEPMLLETNYLPISRCPNLSRIELENSSLYRLINMRYGVTIDLAEETFEPIMLRPMEAQLLGTVPDALGMVIERISYEDDKIVEISKSVSPSYKFKHHIVLKR